MSDLGLSPTEWYIEACIECGCQLGPGIGSRTPNGRCVNESHHSRGGVIVRVSALPEESQGVGGPAAKRFVRSHPELAAVPPNKEPE